VPCIPKIPHIPDEERTPLVVSLLEILHLLQEQSQALRDEIACLKGEKPRPKIKPSKLEDGSRGKGKERDNGKRAGSAKRSKSGEIVIHETVIVRAEGVPAGSTFKGYEDYTVQGLVIESRNTLFRRANDQQARRLQRRTACSSGRDTDADLEPLRWPEDLQGGPVGREEGGDRDAVR